MVNIIIIFCVYPLDPGNVSFGLRSKQAAVQFGFLFIVNNWTPRLCRTVQYSTAND